MIEVNPRVKDALRSGMYPKNYRINVLNDDGTTDFTLNNTELVSESVKIDERMCSGDTLKFGLCEGSSIEFQYFNHDNTNYPNIRGRRIQVFVDVQYKDADGELDWESIPLGFFDIQECSTQFSTGIMKASGFNKLRSEYLDEKCNDAIIEAATIGDMGRSGETSIGTFLQQALGEFAVEPDYTVINDTSAYQQHIVYNALDKNNYIYEKNGDTYTQIMIDGVPAVLFPARYALDVGGYQRDGYVRGVFNLDLINEYVISIYENNPISEYYMYDSDSSQYVSVWDYCMNQLRNYHVQFYTQITLISDYDDSVLKTRYGYNVAHVATVFAIGWSIEPYTENPDINAITARHRSEWEQYETELNAIMGNIIWAEVRDDDAMERNLVFTQAEAEALPDVTLRELQSAVFETSAEFGQLSRVTDLFEGVSLSRERLFPADDLYPANDLYPQGVSESTFKSMYEKLWTDSVGEQKFRKLYITYKGLDEEQREKEFVLERTVNADGTTDYYCDDNWLFKNLVWTAAQVGDYADAMVLKMRGIKWFPFEMWCAGLPYIEVGDELEIISKDGTYTSYVLQRTLNGIQNLKDTYINGSLDIF